ncbi:MAG TPA: phosphoribosylanthranilate isomerase [Thermomicrobiaceae bacterium]|nr:phosphoribosylanthranilate isomerase [Thermomicrobiaceae bacterium]
MSARRLPDVSTGHLVKICSLRTPADGVAAADAGADLVGLILAPARRRVTLETAAEIVAAVHSTGPNAPLVVGVFVDEPVERLNATAEALDLDLVQLHGEEPPDSLAAVARPAIKALRLRPETGLDDARRLAERYLSAAVPPRALTVEAHVADAPGGSGRVVDWTLAARLAAEYPVILAGGLNPDNVAAAIAAVHPRGVDVSSGVEVGGQKDHLEIARFVERARAAFAVPRAPAAPGPALEGHVTERARSTVARPSW